MLAFKSNIIIITEMDPQISNAKQLAQPSKFEETHNAAKSQFFKDFRVRLGLFEALLSPLNQNQND